MLFQSLNFILIFLPLVFALYHLSSNNLLRNLILIASSLIFYAWGNPLWAAILIISASIDFFLGSTIHRLNQKEGKKVAKLALLIISVILNLSLLCFFKYWNWILQIIFNTTKINLTFLTQDIGLPPAISFYTFESLSYIIDIYRRRYKTKNTLLEYLTFISFFPKLVAGPIKRAYEILPPISKLRPTTSPRALDLAIFMICWGLFKKIVIADNLGYIVSLCYQQKEVTGVGFLLVIAFSYQLYADFSAYCDIARGAAKLFAIDLGHNFLTPFFSSNPIEFFKRWNITLSRFVKDYVHIPFSRLSNSPFHRLLSIYFSMFLIGLWHGASVFYVFYGLYVATTIVIYRIFPLDKILPKIFGKALGNILSKIIFFNAVILVSMAIFFCKDFATIKALSTSSFALLSSIVNLEPLPHNFMDLGYGVLIFSLPIFITDFIAYKRGVEFADLYPKFSSFTKFGLYLSIFYIVLFFGFRGNYDFIYFQF